MKHPVFRRTTRVLALLVATAGGIFWNPAIAFAQSPQPVAGAFAYGTFAHVEDTIISERTAQVGVGCGLDAISRQENLAGVNVADLVDVGNIATTAKRFPMSDGGLIVQATSEVEDIELLGGLVGASAVKASSVIRKLPNRFIVHATGTHFANLVVAGIPIDIDVPPNTQVDIPLVGHVSINERASSVGANRASHRTTMLRVVVTLPILFDVGTEIVVANAQTSANNVIAILGGSAYSTSVRVGDLSILDPSFRVHLPCGGTNGNLRSNGGALVALPGVLGSATGLNTAQGNSTPTGAVGTTTATIEDADLLTGLVTADVIFGRAHVETDGGSLTRNVFGSEFIGLSVAGFPEITDSVPLNTHLDILGVGDLWLKRVLQGPGAIQIRMLELTVLDGTVLPVGAVVRVGVARARALGF